MEILICAMSQTLVQSKSVSNYVLRSHLTCYIHSHVNPTGSVPRKTKLHDLAIMRSRKGVQISDSEKLRFVVASPGLHEKLRNMHLVSVVGVGAGGEGGVAVGAEDGVGVDVENPCDAT